MTRDAGKTWTNVIDKVPGLPEGHLRLEGGAVAVRRGRRCTPRSTATGRTTSRPTSTRASDFGQTWQSIAANLKGEVARTLTEDLKNPDVLYLGTETGLFVTIDRAKSWTRLKANLPTVRIDEITLHPRDNAMLLATHGRSIWILDHLEPIQEYAAAQASGRREAVHAAARPPCIAGRRATATTSSGATRRSSARTRRRRRVISWHLKRQAGEVKLKITDAGPASEVREISGTVLANSNKPGYQAACWDLQGAAGAGTRGRGRRRRRQAGAGGGAAVAPRKAGAQPAAAAAAARR